MSLLKLMTINDTNVTDSKIVKWYIWPKINSGSKYDFSEGFMGKIWPLGIFV